MSRGKESTSRLVGSSLMIVSAGAWAGGTLASKWVIDRSKTSSPSLLTLQLVGSVSVLLIFGAVSGQSFQGAWRNGWTGIFEPGLAYLLSLGGLALTSATSATVLASLEPVTVPFIAWVLLRARPTVHRLAFTLVAAFGASLVAWEGADNRPRSGAGDLLVLGGVLAAGIYVVLSSTRASQISVVPLAAAQHAWALGLVAVVTATTSIVGQPRWPAGRWILLSVLTGVLNYALPFVTYLLALRHLTLDEAATHLSLTPVFGVIGAATLLDEAFRWTHVIGTLLIVAALLALARTNRRHTT